MKDLRILSGRGPDSVVTAFVNRRILVELAVQPEDRLVDIGCGDGTLIRMALEAGVQQALGFSGGESEARVLRKAGLNVKRALADSLPLPDEFASVVVCNGVLLLVPEENIPASLSEIARIARPRARIWIGEIPHVREIRTFPQQKTVPAMLRWVLRNWGLRAFLGMCFRLLMGSQRGPELSNSSVPVFFAPPEQFVQMAATAGLKLERHFPHETLDHQYHQPRIYKTRQDYLFIKE